MASSVKGAPQRHHCIQSPVAERFDHLVRAARLRWFRARAPPIARHNAAEALAATLPAVAACCLHGRQARAGGGACLTAAAGERWLHVDGRERRQIGVATVPVHRRFLRERDVLEAQPLEQVSLEAADVAGFVRAGNRDVLKRNVFEDRAVALERPEVDVTGSVRDQGMVAQLDAHEKTRQPVWCGMRPLSDLPDLDSAVRVVDERAGVTLVA